MTLVSDIFLLTAAIGLGFYCMILSRRLRQFTDLENGVGGAVATLSERVDALTKALDAAKTTAGASHQALESQTQKAEDLSRRLELLIASMHDVETLSKDSAA